MPAVAAAEDAEKDGDSAETGSGRVSVPAHSFAVPCCRPCCVATDGVCRTLAASRSPWHPSRTRAGSTRGWQVQKNEENAMELDAEKELAYLIRVWTWQERYSVAAACWCGAMPMLLQQKLDRRLTVQDVKRCAGFNGYFSRLAAQARSEFRVSSQRARHSIAEGASQSAIIHSLSQHTENEYEAQTRERETEKSEERDM